MTWASRGVGPHRLYGERREDRWLRLWIVVFEQMAVAAGLGEVGMYRNEIHPRSGLFVKGETVSRKVTPTTLLRAPVEKRGTSKRDRGRENLRNRYGPWAVVTGASSGIGRAFALELAEAGLNLVVVARSRQALEELAGSLAQIYGVKTRAVAADLSLGTETVEAATRDLDVGLLVAAAGFGTSGSFLDSSLETELEMLDVNCRAPLEMSRHFGRRFARRGHGGIVLMGSVVGFQGTPNAAHYAATKAYVQTLAEALHAEMAPRGVDVLSCAPGPTASGFAERARMRMGATVDPADVARGTLAALGRGPTVLPGALSKVLAYSLAPLPRRARVRVMARVMGGMVKR